MNILRRLTNHLTKKLTFSMEVDSEDILHYSHQKLTALIEENGAKKQDVVVQEYLKNLKYKPIKDFNKELEWFNVSEPLSFAKHLKGKIVVLDFFTYCCINCMHIIPDLREIENEFSIEDGLVVVGVHSAKFENEKLSLNILSAVQRYNITHPVVNDCRSEFWQSCDVHCWPTLLLLGPNANPIVMLMGEGHKENLRLYIRNALTFYKARDEISDHSLPLCSAYRFLPILKGPLLFPGKIANYYDSRRKVEYLAISDTGNNRILIVTSKGDLVAQIGSGRQGFLDGNLEESQFNNPQGLVFLNKDVLYVADTENHAIRKIDLKNRTVETAVGTGKQGSDRSGGKTGTNQEISSPWDVAVYRTPDLDMSFHASLEETPLHDVIIIAMAGSHQIWALFLEDTIWWKFKKFTAGTCICIAGSGREENRNNQYPHAAAFAQPSGLALSSKNREVYIADSESSSVRRLSLVDGKVTAVVGGERNPNNLFAFGDRDGTLYDSKLQHLLGLALNKKEDTLFVADTYNHKLKRVDIANNTVTTLLGQQSNVFNEPGGLCISNDNKRLFVADTNNHLIRIVEIDSNYKVKDIQNLSLQLKKMTASLGKLKNYPVLEAGILSLPKDGGKVIIDFNMKLLENLKLSEEAKQTWYVVLPNADWSSVPQNGSNMKNTEVVVNVPPSEEGSNGDFIDVIFDLMLCTIESCHPKNFIVRQPVIYSQEGKNKEATQKIELSLGTESIDLS